MIYLNWVGQKLYCYNFAPCLCATEIRAFINFQNAMIRLCQPGTADCAWDSYESNYYVFSVASTVCSINIICLDFTEIK